MKPDKMDAKITAGDAGNKNQGTSTKVKTLVAPEIKARALGLKTLFSMDALSEITISAFPIWPIRARNNHTFRC